MKLYTEEQVIYMLKLTNLNVRFYIDTMIPIELPNIKDIDEKSKSIWFGDNYFKEGAKYVLDKIKKK